MSRNSNFVLDGISFNCQISTLLERSFCMPSSKANFASESIIKRDGIIEILNILAVSFNKSNKRRLVLDC